MCVSSCLCLSIPQPPAPIHPSFSVLCLSVCLSVSLSLFLSLLVHCRSRKGKGKYKTSMTSDQRHQIMLWLISSIDRQVNVYWSLSYSQRCIHTTLRTHIHACMNVRHLHASARTVVPIHTTT